MKTMRALQFFFLAAILFLELVHRLVLFGSPFPQALRTASFFVSRSESDHPDHPGPRFLALSGDESCMVNIGMCHSFTPGA